MASCRPWFMQLVAVVVAWFLGVWKTWKTWKSQGIFFWSGKTWKTWKSQGIFLSPPQKYFFSQKKVFIHKDFSHFRRGNLKIFSNHGGLYWSQDQRSRKLEIPRKKSGNFAKYWPGKPGKVREFHYAEVLRTMTTNGRTYVVKRIPSDRVVNRRKRKLYR